MELWDGIHLAEATDRERAVVRTLLEDLREGPFDRDCATTAGQIDATLRRDGTTIEDADVMIAATALVHDVPVVTDDVDHFERIDGLEVLTYWPNLVDRRGSTCGRAVGGTRFRAVVEPPG